MTPQVNLLRVLQARAEARAMLLDAGWFDSFDAAAAPLLRWALDCGLVEHVGAAGVQAIVDTAFAGVMEKE